MLRGIAADVTFVDLGLLLRDWLDVGEVPRVAITGRRTWAARLKGEESFPDSDSWLLLRVIAPLAGPRSPLS